jgi:hypothetical protein
MAIYITFAGREFITLPGEALAKKALQDVCRCILIYELPAAPHALAMLSIRIKMQARVNYCET